MVIRPTKKGLALTKTSKFQKQLGKKVNRLVRAIEKKHIDKPLSFNFGNDAIVNNLSTTTQGNTSGTRDGLKIYARYLHLRGTVAWKTTATQATVVRLIVFIDKAGIGAKPTIAQLLENNNIRSHYNNVNEGKRFVILRDKIIQNKYPSASTMETYVNMKIKLNRNIYYLNSTTNDDSLGKGQVHCILVGDLPTTSTDTPGFNFETRIYYQDN